MGGSVAKENRAASNFGAVAKHLTCSAKTEDY